MTPLLSPARRARLIGILVFLAFVISAGLAGGMDKEAEKKRSLYGWERNEK